MVELVTTFSILKTVTDVLAGGQKFARTIQDDQARQAAEVAAERSAQQLLLGAALSEIDANLAMLATRATPDPRDSEPSAASVAPFAGALQAEALAALLLQWQPHWEIPKGGLMTNDDDAERSDRDDEDDNKQALLPLAKMLGEARYSLSRIRALRFVTSAPSKALKDVRLNVRLNNIERSQVRLRKALMHYTGAVNRPLPTDNRPPSSS